MYECVYKIFDGKKLLKNKLDVWLAGWLYAVKNRKNSFKRRVVKVASEFESIYSSYYLLLHLSV